MDIPSSHRRLITVVCCLMFHAAKGCDLPRNAVAMAGADKVLNCAEGGPFRWYRYLPSDPSNDKVLFMGSQMADDIDHRFRVLKEPHAYPFQRLDLIITNVQADDSGTYKCKQPQNALCAELIVLDSEPKCRAQRVSRGSQETNETEELVEINCSVNVTDNGEPQMFFRRKDGSAATKTNCSRYDGIFTCVTALLAEMLAEYTCWIRIKHKPIQLYTTCNQATNLPDYVYVWTPSTDADMRQNLNPEIVTSAVGLMNFDKSPVFNSLLFIGLPALGSLVIVLFAIVMLLTCRSRKKASAEKRYQKKMPSSPTENQNSEYATLNISPYEEISERQEGLYCTANPTFLAALYSEVAQT